MVKEEKKILNSMEMLKQKKIERAENDSSIQVLLSKFVDVGEAITWLEQQKKNIADLYDKGYENDPYVQHLFSYEKYNRESNNDDPFDCPLIFKGSKQISLVPIANRRYPIMYMTHVVEEASKYCVLNINQYEHKLKENKKVIFIDPCVSDIAKFGEYQSLKQLHELASSPLKKHEWISIDYIVELNKDKWQEYIDKSVKNNFRYASNPQYICCIQLEALTLECFIMRYNELKDIFYDKKKVLGIGCLHSTTPNDFSDKIINFLKHEAPHLHWIHFYGMGLALVKKYLPRLQEAGLRLSFDSTKYKFASNEKIRKGYGFTVGRKMTSKIFFYGYIEKLIEAGLSIIW